MSKSIIGAKVIRMSETNNAQSKRSSLVSDVLFIWLDPNIDVSDEDKKNTIHQVRHIINSYRTFTNIDECINFVTDVKTERIFIIMPCSIDQQVILLTEDIPQLHLLYIVCNHQEKHTEWIKNHKRLKEIFTDIETVSDVVTCNIQRLESYLTSISIVPTNSSYKLEELEPSFMYSQLLKEIIVNLEYDENAIKKFIDFCFQYHAGDANRSKTLLNFQEHYERDSAISWYSKETFLYTMLNKALRTQDTAVIIKIGFFIKDLHQRIEKLHSEAQQTEIITVYRGQGLSNVDFEKLKRNKGGLLSFNNFLSTSFDRDVSFMFADSVSGDPNLIGILFRMTINPSLSSTPFASIESISQYGDSEKEVLFSMHTIFRIDEMEQIQDRLWRIDLILTDDDDQELRNLTEYVRLEIETGSGWQTMGQLMTKMGEFDKAIEIYSTLLETTPDNSEEETIRFLITNYNNIAAAYDGKGDFCTALEYYKKTLEIEEKYFPENHSQIAITYNNMAVTHGSMRNYLEALQYLQKTLEIQQKSLPSNDPQIGSVYNNIATVYRYIGDYLSAISYMEKALAIRKETLPGNHPDLAMTYNNIADLHLLLGNNSVASSDFENAFTIWQKSLPSNHPWLAISYNSIANLQRMNGNYSKALLNFEKALEISQISVLSNHPSLATIHNNMALMYQSMRNYSAAIFHFKKTLEILKESRTLNLSDTARISNNIAGMYQSMGNYSDAVFYLEKTLAILQKSIPIDYILLAATYNNLGETHRSMMNDSIALNYFKKAVELWQKHLPVNHQSLATIYNNMGLVYKGCFTSPETILKFIALAFKTLLFSNFNMIFGIRIKFCMCWCIIRQN